MVTVPILGPIGASIASALTLILTFVFLYFVTARKIDLKIDRDALWKSWVAGLVMVGVLVISQTILANRFYVPIHILIGVVVYLTMLRILHAVIDKDKCISCYCCVEFCPEGALRVEYDKDLFEAV